MSEVIHEVSLGETIDGFHIEELLSKRLYHYVYKVTHPEYTLPMVMKVPRMSVTLPANVISSFETEVRILTRLRGVYTPKVIAKGDLASCPYLVMEYIEENALQQAVQQAPITLDRLTEIMVPVCKAVHELHRHNIIHLDLKPGNIRNRADGRVVILDFGTAHHSYMPDLYEDPHKKAPRSFAYVAPEQLLDVRNDSRSDIFALGVILYKLATGVLPHGKGDPLTVKKRLYLPPVPPRVLNPELPPWLQEVILKCLQRYPQDRFASAKQLAYQLSHPDMVALSELSELQVKPGIIRIVGAWLRSRGEEQRTSLQPHERITQAPHFLLALDVEHMTEDLKQALHNTVRRLMGVEKHSFFTVMTVVENNKLSGTEDFTDLVEREQPNHMHRLMELRHCMKPLKLPSSRVNYQVIEGQVANEILSYAKYHVVDHIVLCARGSSTLRRYMGSVSTKVAAKAPCSVTVVRTRLEQ